MKSELPRGEPEAYGVSSPGLLEFVKALDSQVDSVHGLVLVRHGRVVAEGWWTPYDADTPHQLWSLTKSFTSMAVGLAISEGRFGLDDAILPHFAALAPSQPSENLKAMRVRDLLAMSTGHETEPPNADWNRGWQKAFLAHPVPFKPGTHFVYNTPASGMLAALVEKVTATPLSEYLKPRLFEPLGIKDPFWWKTEDGVTTGGFGLHLRTGEVARFGQLLLQKGEWNGKQLVPRAWIEAATSKQVSNGTDPGNDWNQGYGYQFWMCRNGFFRGDGAFGQFCIVMPDRDAVLAVTSGTGDMGRIMEMAWNKLLPALKPAPLKPDRKARQALAKALKGLSMAPVKSAARPAVKPFGRTYKFPANPPKVEELVLKAGSRGAVTMVLVRDGKEWRIDCGNGKWAKGVAPWGDYWPEPVAASGAWTAPDTYAMRICMLDNPAVHTCRLVFTGDEVLLSNEVNVSFDPNRTTELRGRADPAKSGKSSR